MVVAWNRATCLLHRVFRPLKTRFILCHFGACYFVLTHKSNRKFKTQTGQKTERERERARADKVVWMKRKEKVFNKRIWLIHNMKVIFSSEIRKYYLAPAASYLLEDIVAGWSIISTFFQWTVKQLQIIWKAVLLDISKLNGLGRWEKWRSSVELLASFPHRKKWISLFLFL